MELIFFLPVLLFSLLGTVLYIATIIWSYGDAAKRGKSGCLVALLVAFLAWPLGLVVWLVVRPESPYR